MGKLTLRKTRATVLAAITALVLTLAACSTGDNPGSAGSATDPSGSTSTATTSWPANCSTIEWIVPFSAGGATDLFFRSLAENIKGQVGKDIQVLNVPGAGGQTAVDQLLREPADGCTLYASTIPTMIAYIFPNSPITYSKEDFALAAATGLSGQVLVVEANSKYQSLQDLVDEAKVKGRLDTAADSPQGADPIANGQVAKALNIKLRQAIVDGASEKTTALLGGQLDFITTSVGSAVAPVEAGQVRALAVLTDERLTALPDVPTAAEAGFPGILAYSIYGTIVSADTPPEIVSAIEAAVEKASNDTTYTDAVKKLGLDPIFLDSDEYNKTWDDMVTRVQSLDLSALES